MEGQVLGLFSVSLQGLKTKPNEVKRYIRHLLSKITRFRALGESSIKSRLFRKHPVEDRAEGPRVDFLARLLYRRSLIVTVQQLRSSEVLPRFRALNIKTNGVYKHIGDFVA